MNQSEQSLKDLLCLIDSEILETKIQPMITNNKAEAIAIQVNRNYFLSTYQKWKGNLNSSLTTRKQKCSKLFAIMKLKNEMKHQY